MFCTSCETEKPAAHFTSRNSTPGNVIYHELCRVCHYKELNSPNTIKSKETKVCQGHCGNIKSISDFTRDKRMKDGRRSRCKECSGKRREKNIEEGFRQFAASLKGAKVYE
jgi:hypothetical protein